MVTSHMPRSTEIAGNHQKLERPEAASLRPRGSQPCPHLASGLQAPDGGTFLLFDTLPGQP